MTDKDKVAAEKLAKAKADYARHSRELAETERKKLMLEMVKDGVKVKKSWLKTF